MYFNMTAVRRLVGSNKSQELGGILISMEETIITLCWWHWIVDGSSVFVGQSVMNCC